jgi:hypothetical protein
MCENLKIPRNVAKVGVRDSESRGEHFKIISSSIWTSMSFREAERTGGWRKEAKDALGVFARDAKQSHAVTGHPLSPVLTTHCWLPGDRP